MADTLISIIMPTYNRESFLPKAVDSVLAQTYENWELILVDDGSIDGTHDLMAGYDDCRIKYHYQDNLGVSAARNKGIGISNGEVIALLDSDDEWLPEKLEMQWRYMSDKGYEICQTDEIWVRNGKRVNQPAKYAKPEGWFFEKSLNMCLISPSCTMFTRQVWERIGPFDTNMLSCEDYDMWLRACLLYPVGLVPKPLTIKHGGRDDQLSNCIPCPDMYRIQALIKILQSGQLAQEMKAVALKELEQKVVIYMQGCEKRGKREEAERVWNLFCNMREGKKVPLNSLH